MSVDLFPIRDLIHRRSLLRRILLLAETAGWLTKATWLLTKAALLIVHLSRRSSHLRSANRRRLIRSAQQDVMLVHHRVVDENPLVVGLLLVVDADSRIFAHAGDTNDGSAAEGLDRRQRNLRQSRASRLIGPHFPAGCCWSRYLIPS